MYICDLINNPAFNFNAPFRILWYRGGDETVKLWNLPPEVHIRLTSGGDRVMNPISRTALKSRRRYTHEEVHRSYH